MVLRCAVSLLEIGQLCAVVADVLVDVALGIADLTVGEQENLAGQSVGSAVHGSAGAAAGAVGDFYLLDGVADVGVDQVEPGAVEVAADGAVGVVVDVAAVPWFPGCTSCCCSAGR